MDISLAELLKESFNSGTNGMYTAIPCVVLAIDYADNRVDVQPLVNMLFKDKSTQERPTILAVPVVFPCSSSAAITFPINIGDSVLCVFSQTGIDGFRLSTGQTTSPTDFRKFDKRDGMAIPGLMPFARSVNKQANRTLPHNPRDVVITQNLGKGTEVEIRLNESGGVSIFSPQTISVQAQNVQINSPSTTWSGNITMNGNYTINGTLTVDGVVVNGHTHGGVQGGNATTAGMG